MKNADPRTPGLARPGARSPIRRPRSEADARALARIRTAAAVVRHRQEALYDRLADRFRLAFEQGADRSREAMAVAAEKAREQLTQAGALTKPQGERLKALLLRDLDRTAAEYLTRHRVAAEQLQRAEPESGALTALAIVLESAGEEVLRAFGGHADAALAYRTGEVISAGMLTCDSCGTAMRFRQTGTVPPCPTCAKTRFRKDF